jgi:hypothetical protein
VRERKVEVGAGATNGSILRLKLATLFSSRMWVSPTLASGLGNRLFQHAAATGLAAKWKRDVVFYVPHCDPTNHGPFDTIFKLFILLQIQLLVMGLPDFLTYLNFRNGL